MPKNATMIDLDDIQARVAKGIVWLEALADFLAEQ
jgi:hypothetical protein